MLSARSLAQVLLLSATSAFAAEKVTYVDHVLPIFRNACLNCHNPDKKKAGLDLTTYGGTIAGSENGKVINPGNPDGSLLYKCVLQSEEPKMPPKGDKLTDAELAVMKNWIAGFALENATAKPAAAAQNQVAAAVVSLEKPDGPPPLPGDLPLEPVVRTKARNAVTALAASPWAPLVAIGGQKQVVLYNTETLQTAGILPFPEGSPEIIRFSRNGQLLLTGGGMGGKSGKVVLWNVLTGERAGSVGDEVDVVLAADLSPDQMHVAIGGPTKLLKILSTKDGKIEQSLKKHTDWVTAIAFSPDGKYLASADRSGAIIVWEGATGKEFNTLPGHKAMVTALAFMPNVLASGGEDGKISLWDVKEAKEIKGWAGHAGGVASVDFTPDGRLVSAGRDKIAKVWDQTGKATLTSEALPDIAVRAVLSSERVIAGDWTGKVAVFGKDGKAVGELSANPPPIAEELAGAQKRLADAQAAVAPLQAACTAAEAKVAAETAATAVPPAAIAPAPASNPTQNAELAKKIEQLTAELAKRRDARTAAAQGTPEYTAANEAVQKAKAELASAQAEIGKAAAAPATVVTPAAPAAVKASPAAEELAKAKAALDAGTAKVAGAQSEIEHWIRAEAFMAVHRAKTALEEKKARHEELVATASGPMSSVEQANAQIAELTKAAAEAPAKLQAAAAALAQATQSRDAANKALADAKAAAAAQESAVIDPKKAEAEVAELAKKSAALTAEMAKLREARAAKTAGSPEYAAADALVQGKKPELAQAEAALAAAKSKLDPSAKPGPTPALLAAQEAVKKAGAEAKLAADKLVPAEKAAVKVKADLAAAAQQLAELKKKAPEIAAAATAAKATAEKEAAALATELEKAKLDADRARAEYDAKWRPAGKSVASAPAAKKS